jgi:hypothetical protein
MPLHRMFFRALPAAPVIGSVIHDIVHVLVCKDAAETHIATGEDVPLSLDISEAAYRSVGSGRAVNSGAPDLPENEQALN